jgi:uncharacterized iron-regulated membrane protein
MFGISAWELIRKAFIKIHLYAGLTSGLIVIAVCLSGTIYVYNTEIREMFNSEFYFVEETGQRKSASELQTLLESREDAKVTGVNWNEAADRSVQFSLKKEGEEKPSTFYVNPYTAEFLGNTSDKTATTEFMGYMFSLHRWLLLNKIEEPMLESMSNQDLGRLINGVATLLFTLGVLTGIVIWFPNKVKNWKQGLSVKWDANWKRVNHDLHNTLAFYSLIFLFIMGATGPFWSFTWYKEGYQKTFDTYQAPKPEGLSEDKIEVEVIPAGLISLDEVIAKANAELAYPGIVRVSIPDNGSAPIEVSKLQTGFFARAGADQLKLSQGNLEVTEATLFSELPLRQQIGKSVKALHTGEIFGQVTKFIWFLACLVATSLPITGTLIWWNKRKKKKIARARKSSSKMTEMA